MSVGRLLLRGTVGGFFIGHGAQKLTGAFDGHGLAGTAEMFESIGLRPGKVQAVAAALSETGGGAGLLLGYRTPLSAAAVIATMSTAIVRLHGKNGPWSTNGGYEYNAVLIAAAAALAEVGPGALSVDAVRGREKTGTWPALGALALGLGGAVAAYVLTDLRAPVAVPDVTGTQVDAQSAPGTDASPADEDSSTPE